jgi:hypothetical protein
MPKKAFLRFNSRLGSGIRIRQTKKRFALNPWAMAGDEPKPATNVAER